MNDLSNADLILCLAGAFVTGLAGFAFAIVAAWLHLLPPTQATSLIVAYGVIVQGVAVWKLRRAIVWRRLMPFLIGGAIGVPLGILLLRCASPAALRMAVGVVLVLFSLHNLVRPQLGSAIPPGRWRTVRSGLLMACSAAPRGSPASPRLSGAACAAGPRPSSARPSSRPGSPSLA
jgi:uncharacterized membrane protein YfcA